MHFFPSIWVPNPSQRPNLEIAIFQPQLFPWNANNNGVEHWKLRTFGSMIFYVCTFAHMCTGVHVSADVSFGTLATRWRVPLQDLCWCLTEKYYRRCHALWARKNHMQQSHHDSDKQRVNLLNIQKNSPRIIQESQGCRSRPWCQLPLPQRHCCPWIHSRIPLHFLHLSSQSCSHPQEVVHCRHRFHLCFPSSWWCLSCKGLVMVGDWKQPC